MRITLLLVLLIAIGCNGKPKAEVRDGLDRSTPSATFRLVQDGSENNHFGQVIGSLSKQQKRFVLYETIFSAGMVAGDKKIKLDKLFGEFGINVEKLSEDSTTGEEFQAKVVSRLDNIDEFLAIAQQILNEDSKPRMEPDIVSVEIDGDRAIVTHEITIYGYTKDTDGLTVEVPSTHETKMYMRKNGNDWLVCPEGEWMDREFKWTVPTQ